MFTRHLLFKFYLFVLMTLIASIITFSKKKNPKIKCYPRHGTLALHMEPSTLDPRQKDRLFLTVYYSQFMRNRIPCQRDAGTRLATALRRRPFSACNQGNRRRLHAGNANTGSPHNDVVRMSAEIPYWWYWLKQIFGGLVVNKFPSRHAQTEVPPVSG